jgi:hypothetical protein
METIITAAVIFCVFIWMVRASKNKSKMGINLNKVYCPICNTKQPFMRMPANGEQFLYGGTTCPQCHTNLDKYGSVI